jgi:hypothetical protein
MARWRLYVLGAPRVERDGAAVPLGLRKGLALLVYLAVTGRAHRRDALATLLWPECPLADGRARPHRTAHDLTSRAGRGLLTAGPDTLGPAPAPAPALWLDSADFERRTTAAGPAGAVELERAVALYGDGFLAGVTVLAVFMDGASRVDLTLVDRLGHGLAVGGAIGLSQWLVLRRRFDGAGWWVAHSTASWVAAEVLVVHRPHGVALRGHGGRHPRIP